MSAAAAAAKGGGNGKMAACWRPTDSLVVTLLVSVCKTECSSSRVTVVLSLLASIYRNCLPNVSQKAALKLSWIHSCSTIDILQRRYVAGLSSIIMLIGGHFERGKDEIQ